MKVIIHTNGREEDVEEEEGVGVGEEEEGEGVEEEEEGVGEEREGVGGSCARRFLRTNCGAGDEDKGAHSLGQRPLWYMEPTM